MYFLNRKEITEFQNKCVIAMFLDSHRDLFLKEYIGKNQFKAINLEGNTITINLFQNVTKISKSNNVIHLYLTRKSTYKKEACIYYVLDDDFIRKYKEFVQNPFIYIIHAFQNYKWQYKYEILFHNDSLSLPNQLCKYISDPKKDEDGIKRFEKFMKGTVTFVNPKTCNDPFDCDCELDFEEKFKYVFEMSLIKTKYDKTTFMV